MRTRRISFGQTSPRGDADAASTPLRAAAAPEPPANGLSFTKDLRTEVAAYFEQRGLSTHADAKMVWKTVAMLALTFVPYGLILAQAVPPLGMLGLALLMGLGVAGLGFSVAHDAHHGSYTRSRRLNDLLGISLEVLGGSRYFWRLTHNTIHHTYTNVPGVDEDLVSVEPLVRLAPTAPYRPYHRFQHLYAWPLYALAIVNWVFLKDYKYLAARRIGPYEDMKHPRSEVVRTFAFKGVHHAWTLVIPMLVLSVAWWQVVVGYLAMNLLGGLVLAVVFQLAHVTEGPEFPVPDSDGRLADEWHVHQFRTTANFAPGNRLATWFLGGLNHQVEHHAFPRICSTHYPAIAPIVERVCRRHGVPYNVQPSVRASIASHFRLLKRFGAGEGQVSRPGERADAGGFAARSA